MNDNVITLNVSTKDALMKMSEGNPGAITVLCKLMEKPLGFIMIFKLDDAGIRGSKIWTEYKDVCGENIDKFYAKIENNEYYKKENK